MRPRVVLTTRLIVALIVAALGSCASGPPQSLAPPQPPVPAGADQAAVAAQRAYEQAVAEEALANHIYRVLNADPIYYFRHVDVKVHDGVADLSGYVWSTDAIYRARKLTSQVSGVTSVVTTQLQLERNGRDAGPAR